MINAISAADIAFIMAYCTLRNETKRNEICTLRNENLYFAKWNCVLYETKICTQGLLCFAKRNETKWNLYFTKWKSVFCEMKICTLRNENLYFAKWNLYFAKWKRRAQNLGPRTKRKQFFRACLPRIASAKLALSIVLSPPLLSALGGLAWFSDGPGRSRLLSRTHSLPRLIYLVQSHVHDVIAPFVSA